MSISSTTIALALLLVLWLVCRNVARRWDRRRIDHADLEPMPEKNDVEDCKTQIADSHDTTIVTKEI